MLIEVTRARACVVRSGGDGVQKKSAATNFFDAPPFLVWFFRVFGFLFPQDEVVVIVDVVPSEQARFVATKGGSSQCGRSSRAVTRGHIPSDYHLHSRTHALPFTRRD